MTIQKAITEIKKVAGYRELNILNDLQNIKNTIKNKDYNVYRFFDSNNNYFDFEFNSKRITG